MNGEIRDDFKADLIALQEKHGGDTFLAAVSFSEGRAIIAGFGNWQMPGHELCVLSSEEMDAIAELRAYARRQVEKAMKA